MISDRLRKIASPQSSLDLRSESWPSLALHHQPLVQGSEGYKLPSMSSSLIVQLNTKFTQGMFAMTVDHNTALSPHTWCCWHCIPTVTNDTCPQKAIAIFSFRDQPRSLSFRYTATFVSNLSVTSKPITLEFHSHSSLSGFPVFDVSNSHLGTIWGMYSCYSGLSNAPSRERPD